MKLKWISLIALAVGLSALTGCVETVDGRHRAGMPIQKDRVEGRYERPLAEVFTAAQDVLKFHGTITSEDTVRSSIQGVVEGRNIWIAIERVDSRISRILVQARKSGLGDLDLAAYLEKEIAVRLATGKINPASPKPPK